MNILVVDDEEVMAESLRIGLTGAGFRVVKALSAGQARDVLARDGRRIDLALVDYLMPVDNGFDLLAVIREKYGDLPVVIMTAYPEAGLGREAFARQANGFLEKPFNLENLVAEIQRVLQKSAGCHRSSIS